MIKYMRLVRFLKNFKRDAAGKILIGIMSVSCGFFQAFMVAGVVAAVLHNKGNETILSYLAGALISILARAFLSRYNEGYSKQMSAKVKGAIRTELLDQLMKLGPAYQNTRRSGNVQSLITDGVESFEAFLVNYIPQTAVVFLSATAVICYIFSLDQTVGLMIFSSAVLSIIVPHFFMPAVSRVMIEYWQSYAHLNAQYIEAMQGMNTLKAFHAEKKTLKQLKADSDDFANESIRNTGISLADSALIILLSVVGTSVSVAVAAWHTSLGMLSAQELLIILFLAGECMRPLTDLNSYWHASYLGLSVANQLFAVLDAPMVLEQKPEKETDHMKNIPPDIELKEVTFRYSEEAAPALSEIQIQIPRGKTTAIVGKSGSGKSTIVNLLLRFFDVNSGRILIDGIDVRDFTLEYLRSKIAVVFQETYLFYGTMEENLRMAKPTATMEEIIAATKAANVHSFIQELPDGYQTMVGERGASLSGGERQRVAIARAILKNAPILILDEATSSVDVESERLIQQSLSALMKNRTTIIIAHRLSTIAAADRIFVLNEGRLWEQGTHGELLEQNGEYANLIKIQQRAGRLI
ncbi:MAG: transporter related [Bacillota bacterium]|jgi:ABC-type multidrug transport system fused ATPase/permease subunit|nr:transporter related [Bacillota bacterium]